MVNRIKQVLDWQQLSPTQFADRIGIGRPVVSHILSERNKPSLDVLQHIRAAFPELSTDWLLDGRGPMLQAVSPTPVEPAAPAAPAPVPAPAPARAAELHQPVSASPAARLAPPVAAVPPLPVPRPSIPRFQRTQALNTPQDKVEVATESVAAAEAIPSPEVPASPVVAPAPLPAAALPTADSLPPQELPPASISEPVPAPMSAAALLAEPGKAIRRIVIFYRDGSFADYQPED